ncbi:MAG: 3-isopropylmalate dehydratase large subunit [Erysipelotrichaceae bacterium]|nr:3-isopropylmalate dehydratase large subunit [Erysipelotrichaceae bacterium]
MSTLYEKVLNKHIIKQDGELLLIYIDRHYIHEITSPQAFEGLKLSNRKVRRADKTFGTMDHNTPTTKKERENIVDELAKMQLDALKKNCEEYGIKLVDMDHNDNGIVHIIGPELGLTLPGNTIVCGDSHTATHGAFGALAFGIGTSEVEHVLATQTIWNKKLKNLGIKITGKLNKGVYAKDVILALIRKYGVSIGNNCAAEFYGDTIENMSMDERMTICNMAIEAGAKVGMIKPDQKTLDYLKNTKYMNDELYEKIVEESKTLYTDNESDYDKIITLDVTNLKPQITWGTNPSLCVSVDEKLPESIDEIHAKAYSYMDLKPGMDAVDIPVEEVFIGSCTNGRYSDLLEAYKVIKGKKVKEGIKAIIVPGSMAVYNKAIESGIKDEFIKAGFEFRLPGCSSCLGMNPDLVKPYAHCISSSNRNFEGRQGANSRTHLASPATAAASAIYGKVVDISKEEYYGEV